MLAEPADAALLVEVRPGGGAAPRPGSAGAARLPPDVLDPGRSRCVAPQHRTSALPLLQVCPLTFVSQICRKREKDYIEVLKFKYIAAFSLECGKRGLNTIYKKIIIVHINRHFIGITI